MNTTDYLIRLQPVGPYYFGQEVKPELGNRNAYFQHSADFPQQSALLGLMRYEILMQLGISLDSRHSSKGDESEARKVIGDSGFNPWTESTPAISREPLDFGYIHSLSPIFIIDGVHSLFHRNKEYVRTKKGDKKQTKKEISLRPVRVSLAGSHGKLGFDANGETIDYTSKDEMVSLLATSDFCERLPYEAVIHDQVSVGINKHWGPSETEDSYYMRTYKSLYAFGDKVFPDEPSRGVYRKHLVERYAFGMYARLNKEFPFQNGKRVVFFGKERSTFLLEVTALPQQSKDLDDYFPHQPDEPDGEVCKAMLLSDAFVDESDIPDMNKLCLLQLTDTVQFRHIVRRTERQLIGARPTFSGRLLNLIKRGSVFYMKPDSKKQFVDIFKKQAAFRQIGYNYFLIFKVKVA